MRFRVEKDAPGVLAALAADSSAIWVVLGSPGTQTPELAALERDFAHRELVASLTGPERAAAVRLALAFFEGAAAADPAMALNFAARVPLAIPDWDQIQNVFRLRVLRSRPGGGSLVIWLADPRWQELLPCAGLDAAPVAGTGDSRRGRLRVLRTLIRCLIHRRPRVAGGARLWLSVGSALRAGAGDTYFGAWIGQAPGNNFRVYLAPGRSLRLGTDGGQAPLEAFASPVDVFAAWWHSRRPLVPAGDFASDGDRRLWLVLAGRETDDGDRFTLDFQRRAFARMLRRLRPKSIVIPFEFRAWERAVTASARSMDIAVVGYQHSSLTPRHLALIRPASDWRRTWLPDRVITCGEVTATRLGPLAAATQVDLQVGASLRVSRMDLPPPGNALLVAISSSRGESLALIRAMAEVAGVLRRRIIIRPHPTIPVQDLFGQFAWPEGVELSGQRPLAEDLAAAGIVVYSSSTVALEGMLHGRLPLYLDIGDLLSGDPIDDGEFKLKAGSAAELAACVADVDTWAPERLARAREAGRAYAVRYLVSPTPAMTESMTALLAP